jgi:hypothetical protein
MGAKDTRWVDGDRAHWRWNDEVGQVQLLQQTTAWFPMCWY